MDDVMYDIIISLYACVTVDKYKVFRAILEK